MNIIKYIYIIYKRGAAMLEPLAIVSGTFLMSTEVHCCIKSFCIGNTLLKISRFKNK